MKILGGKFKGRNIIVPPDIRPLSLRIKKACFDILRGEIEGKKVLDLFAGSGSLGIEAISQGASRAVFVDSNRRCVTAVKKNVLALDISLKVDINLKDAFSAVKDFFTYRNSFDIIFLDPPYGMGSVKKALQTLEGYDILTPSGYIVALGYWRDDFLRETDKFSIIVDKKYGQTLLLIYIKK